MSTSKLQRRVKSLLLTYFPSSIVEENIRPSWLATESGNRLELDFYIECLGVALEVQGAQHFTYVAFFHKTLDTYDKAREADARKKELCAKRNIELIEVCNEPQAARTVKDLALRYYSDSPLEPRAVKIIMKLAHLKGQRKRLNEVREKEWKKPKGVYARKKKIKWLEKRIYLVKQERRGLMQELESALGSSIDPTELDKMIYEAKRREV